MGICNVEFGTTAAETELMRTPKLFDEAFFDPNNYLQELVDGYKFIVSGRKGDGKTAFSAKIERLSVAKSSNVYAIIEDLEHLNSKFFDKFTDEDLSGGKRYVPMWKCIILLELTKYLQNKNFRIEKDNYLAIVDALDKMGLLSSDGIDSTITKLDATEISISVKNWVTYGRRIEREKILKGANDIYSALEKELSDVYLSKCKFRMIIDGLDDILRNKEFKPEIVTGLVRAANEVNNSFLKKALNFKVIVLVRSDILDKCRDPDISKIKNASLIALSWKPIHDAYDCDLGKLVLQRFKMANLFFDDFKALWTTYFPTTIDAKDSLAYMLENTLYKPRDMLVFFLLAKKMIGPVDRKLCETEFKEVLRMYSEEYFYSQMQDELTGFVSDNAIDEIAAVVSQIGSRTFTLEQFEEEAKNHAEFENESAENVLRVMFDRGYIGQYRKRPDHPKEEFYFQISINQREKFSQTDTCQIHRGLVRAFGI